MAQKKVLFAWLGNSDINAIGQSFDHVDKIGPIAAAVKAGWYDAVVILVADDRKEPTRKGEGIFLQREKYIDWVSGLHGNVAIETTDVTDSTDMVTIHTWTQKCIEDTEMAFPGSEKTFHLSPGTPFMAHVWIILRSDWKAKLIKSDRLGNVYPAVAPDDIATRFFSRIVSPNETLSELDDFVARSESMQNIIGFALKAAPHDTSILIEGETGVGKTKLAELIHKHSKRKKNKFVPINCGAIPTELLESELFGHKKGSFTGATADKIGIFEKVNGGTLFLDEIGELIPAHQVKVLDAIQRKEITRIGDDKRIKVDVRLISATNRQLLREVNRGNFRKDLYYRIAVWPLTVPPLRERKEDLAALIDIILVKLAQKGFGNKSLSREARRELLRYDWPGNIRELMNILERVAILSSYKTIISKDDITIAIPQKMTGDEGDMLNRPIGNGFSLDELLLEIERPYLKKAWESSHKLNKAAELLGMNNSQTFRNHWERALGELPRNYR